MAHGAMATPYRFGLSTLPKITKAKKVYKLAEVCPSHKKAF